MGNLTPMMRQYHQVKEQNPDTLLFFRLGDFYEMFYEDAVTASRELEITLTSRNRDNQGRPIPMCGVPYHAASQYLAKLLRKGYKVALCDQVEDARQAKGIVRREVTRILTPGTVIDDSVLESKENNYLAALFADSERTAAAVLDVSTGDFWSLESTHQGAWERTERELLQFGPREILLPQADTDTLRQKLPNRLKSNCVLTPQPDWVFNWDYGSRILRQHFEISTLEGIGLTGHPGAIAAAGALLHYVQQTQKSELSHIAALRFLEPSHYLKMDESTVQNLELIRGLDGNRQWTLLATVDRTRTGMGGRLLRNWMLRPELDLVEINQRLEAVQQLLGNIQGMGRLGAILEKVHDLERLLSRVTMGTANARDLLALKDSLQVLPELKAELGCYSAPRLRPEFDLLKDVCQLLERSLDEDAPTTLNEGRLIRTGYDSQLDRLRDMARSGKSFIAGIEASERERTGIPSLKVKYNRVFGYFIEVTRANLELVPDDYLRKQTLANSERFITPELKEYEEKVLGAEEQIVELEKELFLSVRSQVALQAQRIGRMARVVAVLDVLVSFAEVAQRCRYVRPELDESHDLVIEGGRHPVVEQQADVPFVPNDLNCNITTDQMLILTGPNMGGKSTYLRQNALIVVLAQMGSFVPADGARIGLVDRIFTRVGASDNLARGRSTFMVEMIETAKILNTATPRSLILLDEVGRGTATFDGLSIAWSVAEYLIEERARKGRTLFATHYQELTRLEQLYPGVRNYCVTIRESGDRILFFHRVVAGSASKSYGIEVARLAGLPGPVIDRARQILKRLERKQLNLTGSSRSEASSEVFDQLQQTLFQA